jgi:hypothetical protein
MDAERAGDGSRSVSIYGQFGDGRFDFRFAGIVGVFGIKCLMRTFLVFADVPLFAIVQSVFAYAVTPAKRAFQGNKSLRHRTASLTWTGKNLQYHADY